MAPARTGAKKSTDPATTKNGGKALAQGRTLEPEPALFSLESVTGDGMKKIADRYYQVDAVRAIATGLSGGGRGQLRSACGTGKTVMSQRAAELVCPRGGVVVVVCPSIALVSQTLREWAVTNSDHVALVVCGDKTISGGAVLSEGGRNSDETVLDPDDFDAPVTTDPQEVAKWLRQRTTAGLRLIVGTHRSAHVIGEALISVGRKADLLIVDEAHRAAGPVDKHTALVHDDEQLPAERRLYATATPKIIGEKAIYRYRNGRGRGGTKSFAKQMIGMDDEETFGPVLYNYPFSKAIDDGYLDDYRLLVMGATRREIADYLASLPGDAIAGNLTTSLHTAMVQTVLAKAAAQYGLRRVLTFCRRLNEAADFARTMNSTLAALPASMKPDRPLTASFVHGGMTTAEREHRLGLLVDPPRKGWTVVTNVRCLAEGVDVPAIDAVAFTHPKQSVSEIVQAVGRALRRDPEGTGTATILVPILLPDDPDDLDEADVSDYRLLWQVVRALRAHDDKLGATIDRAPTSGNAPRYYYEEQPLEHLMINLPEGYDDGSFLHHLTAKIISSARSEWWDGYAVLKKFYDTHGHSTVESSYTDPDIPDEEGRPFRLGKWCENTRARHREGRLAADRIAALEEVEFDFLPRPVEWAKGLRAATTFYAQYGHLEPVRSLRVDDVELLAWLDRQRALAAAGEMADSRRAALDALAMRWHEKLETFADYISALSDYHARRGDIDIPPDPNTPDGRLGSWLVSIRMQRKRGLLGDEEIAALDALGMRWSARPVTLPTFSSGT